MQSIEQEDPFFYIPTDLRITHLFCDNKTNFYEKNFILLNSYFIL